MVLHLRKPGTMNPGRHRTILNQLYVKAGSNSISGSTAECLRKPALSARLNVSGKNGERIYGYQKPQRSENCDDGRYLIRIENRPRIHYNRFPGPAGNADH